MEKKFIIVMILLLLSCVVIAQTINSFALWTSMGYNNFFTDNKEVLYPGGFGGDIGLGYDLLFNGLLFQVGGELEYYSSNAILNNFVYKIPMRNTEGILYDGIFSFHNNIDYQTMGNVGGVIKIGFITPQYFYMLLGGKYGYNIYGNSTVCTKVTSKGYYERIIGDDDDGILSQMPNHGYYTTKRDYREKIEFSPLIRGSIEAGIQFNYITFLGGVPRIAFMMNFGFTDLPKLSDYNSLSIIKDISNTEEFQPALRPFFYRSQESKVLALFASIKLTLLFGSTVTSYCQCIQDINKKNLKRRHHR